MGSLAVSLNGILAEKVIWMIRLNHKEMIAKKTVDGRLWKSDII